MTIKVKTGEGIGVRNTSLSDASFELDTASIVYGETVFAGVFDIEDPSTQITALTPEIATVGIGGELVKVSDGVARFIVRSRGVKIPVSIDLTDSSVPPTVINPPTEPPPTEPPPTEPTYSVIIDYMLSVSGPEIQSMIQGLSGGALNMNLWSVRSPSTKTYTRNPNFWANPIVSQLTGAVAYKETRAKQSYGGILISPRHVLYCDHAHPHAANTWPVNYGDSRPCVLQFVLADGTCVEGIQIAQTQRRPTRSQPGAYTPEDYPEGEISAPDLCVAVLDRDMQALGCHVMPIPNLTVEELGFITSLNIPTLNVTQGYERSTQSIPPTPISNYPQYHQAMFAIGRGSRSGTPYELFDYAVWDGDSGTPAMILVDETLYLERILLWGGGGGQQPARFINHINNMLQVAEADAIARGVLSEPTGLTIPTIAIPVPDDDPPIIIFPGFNDDDGDSGEP